MIKLHQRMGRNGYSIPATMSWLWWPLGTKATIEYEVAGQFDYVTGAPFKINLPNPVIERARIERQYVITNREAWMALMLEFKAVRPA
jgi:hypothetical protein